MRPDKPLGGVLRPARLRQDAADLLGGAQAGEGCG